MVELLSTAEMAEADRLTVASGFPGRALMENAGRAVAEGVMRRTPPGSRISVIAGPGNNGGDGFVAARLMSERGYRVRVLLLGERDRLKGDAALAARDWKGNCEPATPGSLRADEVVIDALFGAGLDRPVEGSARALIEAMNGIPNVHAVDLPSGINGTTGAVMGVAVRATQTVTFFRKKLGHVLMPGRAFCGTTTVADIGIAASVLATIRPQTWLNAPDLWADDFPTPSLLGHKYSRGHAVVVSGGFSSTGAARLAARGALRAGAGLVTTASPRDALAVNATCSLAVMVRAVDGAGELAEFLSDPRRNVVVVGPGGGVGRDMRELVFAALAGERSVVLDADALTSFAADPNALIAAIRRGKATAILTPHEGEFSRFFNSFDEISKASSKVERARQAAALSGAICLLKGPDTVIASPDRRCVINGDAPPFLATAGSGDVLAGIVAGLLAQGMPCFEAGCAGVWLHGQAGSLAGPGLIAEDLPECLPRVYSQIYEQVGARQPKWGITSQRTTQP